MVAEKKKTKEKRLGQAAYESRRKLEPFRTKRVDFVRQYEGKHYSDNGSEKDVPVPIIGQFIDIYRQELTANNPQTIVLTEDRLLKSEAKSFEKVLNDEIRRMRLGATIRDWGTEALYQCGFLKVGISEYDRVEIDGIERVLTMPYAVSIGLDDWVHDMTAKTWPDVDYMGDKYRVPLEDVKDNDLYDQDLIKKYCESGTKVPRRDEFGNDNAASTVIGEASDSTDEEYRDYIDLWDIYFPQENMFRTFIATDNGETLFAYDKPIREEEWLGPVGGPYHRLAFKEVPDSTMPLSPVANIYTAHLSTNGLVRKAIWQAMNAKSVLGFAGTSAKDAERILRAGDLDTIRLDHPEGLKEMRFNSLDTNALGLASYMKTVAYENAGNLAALGGLTAQSDTLGQDRILLQSASKVVQSLQSTVIEGVRGVIEDIAWYLWNDPNLDRMATHEIPGTGITVDQPVTADNLQGDFSSYEFQVVPYSMQDRSPQQRLGQLMEFFNGVLMPMMQAGLLDQHGMTPDIKGLVETYARYAQMEPELKDILVFADEKIQPAAAPEGGGRRPQFSHKINETRQGPQSEKAYEQEFQKSMFSGGKPESV